MKSDQELLSESRSLLNLITNELSIPRCRAYIEEFVEKYETWPSLAEVVSSLAPKRKDDKKRLGTLEKKAFREIQRTFDVLTKKCARKQINIPQNIIDAYEQRTISSAGYTTSRFEAVKDLLFLLHNKGELSAIKKFVVLNNNSNIDMFIFSPSFVGVHQNFKGIKLIG